MTAPTVQPQTGQQALSQALRQSFTALRVLMLLVALAYLASGFFIVQQHEKAVILVFGTVRGVGEDAVRGPGFHWTWPRPIAEIIRIPAERVQSLVTDTFWHEEMPTYLEEHHFDPRSPLDPFRDGYTLSADANLFHSRWAVRYSIIDTLAHLFHHARPEDLLHRELDRAILAAAAQTPIDHALRTGIETLRGHVERELRHRIDSLNLGIRIQGVDLLQTIPPRQVAFAFHDVVQAEQTQAQTISDARAFATRRINEARGEADRYRSQGLAAKERFLNQIRADADTFQRLRNELGDHPQIILAMLKHETIRHALQSADQRVFLPPDPQGRRELRLQLGRPESTDDVLHRH